MSAIDNFLKRWGFVKLDRFGLVLTPDERVLSTRPAVLDDGLGGKIVGWLEGDLAAMELDRWGVAGPPAAATPVAAIPSLQSTARPVPPTSAPRPPIAVAPVVVPATPPPRPAPVAAASPAVVSASIAEPGVAAEPVVEEDEWEWEIAVARARAEAIEEARLDLVGVSAMIATAVTPPPPLTPTLTIARSERDSSEPEDWDVMIARATAAQPAEVAPSQPSVASHRTVIPVPQLPTAARPSDVRPAPYTPTRRLARGTGRIEDTVRTQAGVPANDDHTSPYVTLPSEVRPAYAHTKRVAAKR